MRHALIATLVLLPVLTAGARPLSLPADEPPVLRPYFAMAGPWTEVQERCYALVRTQEAFAELWERHRGDAVERAAQGWPLAPQVDFERCMVLAVFSGERTNCNGEQVVSIDEDGDHLRVRYDSMTFQTASFDGDSRVPSRPYGLFVIPRGDKPVLIEENTQNLIGGPPIWTARAVLAPEEDGDTWFVRR